MDITETISLLDELRVKIGNRDIEINKDHIPQECALFIKAVVENYPSLRQAALDGERYRKAGEELANGLKEMDTVRTEIFRNFFTETDWRIERDQLLQTYRQAVNQKEV